MWWTRLTDCLRILSGCGGRGLRIAYGFLPDIKDEAYELLADFYRMWWRRLTDCLRIFTGCGGRSLRIVYRCLQICTGFGGAGLRIVSGFGPDLEEKAYGLLTDFY